MTKKSFKIRGNLAEALGDTVNSANNNAGELLVEIIPLRKIELDPDNPRDLDLNFEDLYQGTMNIKLSERKIAEKESLASLAKSIQEQGVINPIVVYKHNDVYRLIAGERRTLSSIIAGKADIPARVLTSRPDQLKLSLIQWIENIEREDLSLWERLRNLEKIIQAYATANNKQADEVSPTEISHLVSCSLQQGVNYRHILNASDDLKSHIKAGGIKNIEKAAFVSKSPEKLQEALTQACLNGSTLSELKKISHESLSTPQKIEKNKSKIKINLGSTQNTNVAKIIIKSVIENENLKHLSSDFSKIQWDDQKAVANAFRKLIKLLEQM
jgi:ParB family chromosome partitioning protein